MLGGCEKYHRSFNYHWIEIILKSLQEIWILSKNEWVKEEVRSVMSGVGHVITVVRYLDYQVVFTITILRHRQWYHDNHTTPATLIANNLLPSSQQQGAALEILGRGLLIWGCASNSKAWHKPLC